MSYRLVPMIAACCLLLAPMASAQDAGFTRGNRYLPVLVSVDDRGQVTQVDPAIAVRTDTMHALRSMMDRIVTGPATYEGHGVASDFVVMLRLDPSTSERNIYRLVMASARPVRSGHMHWQKSVTGATYHYGLATYRDIRMTLPQPQPRIDWPMTHHRRNHTEHHHRP